MKKIVATVILTVVVLALALTCFSACVAIENALFNKEVKKAYTKVLDDLEEELMWSIPDFDKWNNREIVSIRFGELQQEDVTMQVFAQGVASLTNIEKHGEVFYRVAINYYNALVSAEAEDNIMAYIEALKTCIENLQLIGYKTSNCPTNFDIIKEEPEKFNEIFNLSEYGLKQVGFLPQFVEYHGNKILENGMQEYSYTFKGLSFVKTDKGKGCGVLPKKDPDIILNSRIKKNNVDVYETDFTVTFQSDPTLVDHSDISFISAIYGGYIKGTLSYAYEIVDLKCTHIKNISSDFLVKVQNGGYDFKKAN